MKVEKRNGKLEQVNFDKIKRRLKELIKGNDCLYHLKAIKDVDIICQEIISKLYDGVKSREIDEEVARICVSSTEYLDMPVLASRIIVSNLHKNTFSNYSEYINFIYNNNIISEKFYNTVNKHYERINQEIDYDRDYSFEYFGFKTLENAFLLKVDKKVIERPQQMYMRVAFSVFDNDVDKAINLYHYISNHYYTHASPTLFNAGLKLQNLSSCFLKGMDDSIDGIYKSLSDCAKISKVGGGIGIHISNVRARGSKIRGTNGESYGITSMLQVFEKTSLYVDQSGRRKGSYAIFLEPWHADIMEFLELRLAGADADRARHLFYGLWVPDLFMEKVKNDQDWYLMCPDECPGLNEVYGDDFVKLYESFIEQKKYRKIIKAQDIWRKILSVQIETGMPYICYKDSVNQKCNQKNLGTIKSSNLCCEISLYSDSKEYAVCNLSSINLTKFVNENLEFNFKKLESITEFIVEALNNVIDNSYCPVVEGTLSNSRHRPIGIGIQGLADVFAKMGFAYDSPEAKKINIEISETIYYSALKSSINLSKKYGSYSSFKDSPFSKGILQMDMWESDFKSTRYDWDIIRQDVQKYGARNSMLTAYMPTATTAQIMGNSECFEPLHACFYKKRVLSGEFSIINKYLLRDLSKLKLWNKRMEQLLLLNDGSIQNIKEIPQNLKNIYKTCWEVDMKCLIEYARDRSIFIDQMQSLNFFIQNPTWKNLNINHFRAWKSGLKTGMYYLRSAPVAEGGKFSVSAELEKSTREEAESCPIGCTSCSS